MRITTLHLRGWLLLCALLVVFLLWAPAFAASYYVSPTGDDGNSGLDTLHAWATIDNGDQLGILIPGDTVNVLAGTYLPVGTIDLSTSGTNGAPILYRKLGMASALIDGTTHSTTLLALSGNHAIIDGLEIINGTNLGIDVLADSCVVMNCHVHDCGARGIRSNGEYNLLLRNTVSGTGVSGIEAGGQFVHIYNNTVFDGGTRGIHFVAGVNNGRAFNNISAGNTDGIRGKATIICGFNLVWSNANDYTNGVVDSAGGLSADPRFVDTAAEDFSLQAGSPCIDAGLDLGYPYAGAAPDIGADEVITGADLQLTDLTVSPTTVGASRTFSACSFTLANNGPDDLLLGELAVTYYLSTNPVLGDGDDVNIGQTLHTVSISAGGQQAINLDALSLIAMTASWPADQPCGYYYIFARVGIVTALTNDSYLFNNYDRTDYTVGYTGCPVPTADLEVAKDVDSYSALVGDSLLYTISVDNLGPSDVTGVVLTDLLPTGLTWVSDSTSQGFYNSATGDWNAGPIANGSTASLYVVASVDQGATASSIENIASVKSAGLPDSDSTNNTSSVIVSIGDRSPVIAPIDSQSVLEGDQLDFTVSATDGDGDALTLTAANLPQHAAFVDSGDGTGGFTFTPSASQAGVYTVRFIAADFYAADTEDVVITVINKNFAPKITPIGPKTVEAGQTLNFTVSANDPDNDSLTLHAKYLPANSSFVDNGNRTGDFSFSPTFDQDGIYSVLFTASDGVLVDSELVMITVVAVNAPPVLDSIGAQSVQEGGLLDLIVSASDANASIPALRAENTPANSTFTDNTDGTGEFVFNPDYTQAATYNVLFIASDGLAEDSELVAITVTPAPTTHIAVFPDSAVVSADSTLQFTVKGYDAGNVENNAGNITWSLTSPIGTISSSGLFDATTVGTGRVIAVSDLGLTDTSSYLAVTPGAIALIEVSPDSAQIVAADSGQFMAQAYDSDSNLVGDITNTATWTTTDPSGSVAQGLYVAGMDISPPGYYVKAQANGVADSGYVEVVYNITYDHIAVTPDTASLRVDDAVTFKAIGYNDFNEATVLPAANWEVIGGIGTIDANGNFTATTKGFGKIKATTLDGLSSDSSNMIVVELPIISTTPLGNQIANPAQSNVPVLAFNISNPFDLSTGINTFSIRHRPLGSAAGSAVTSDVDSLTLWRDVDGNSIVNSGDQRLTSAAVTSNPVNFNLSTVAIDPYSQSDFLVTSRMAVDPRDGDSLDFFLLPSQDITTSDGVTIAGLDTINSLGYTILDGMVARQVTISAMGNKTISPSSTLYPVMAVDIPRNGYEQDTLQEFSIINRGTGGQQDVDSLLLFKDDGDNTWNGPSSDQQVGVLSFTGELWSASGMSAPLTQSATRFFVAVKLPQFPNNGKTFAFGIPMKGIEVASGNDGPIDATISPVDTVTILSSQIASIEPISIPTRTLTPGSASGPLTIFTVTNGTPTSTTIQSVKVHSYLSDPLSATQAQLDSQVDSAVIYLKLHAHYDHFDAPDTYLGSGLMRNGDIVFDSLDLPLEQNGGSLELAVGVYLNTSNCRNGNKVNLGITDAASITFSNPLTLEGEFPVKNTDDFTINAFPAAAIKINRVPGKTLYPGQMGTLVLDFELPRNGYASDRLRGLRLSQVGTESSLNALSAVKLYADAGAAGFSGDDEFVGSFVRNGESLVLSNLNRLLTLPLTRFFVVVDVSEAQFDGGNFNLEVATGGATYASGMTGPDDVAVGNTDYHLLLPSDRITVVSIPVESKQIYPGSTDNILLAFALYNGYSDLDQLLKSIRLTNTTASAAGDAFADEEIGLLSLYLDENSDGSIDGDPLLATGSFGDGKLLVSGLSTDIAAQSILYFLVTADISDNAVDSDSLRISIESSSDISFSQVVNMNGDLPLTTGLPFPVDGSIAAQYRLLPVNPRSLVVGQDTVSLFGFSAAANGILVDNLNSLTIENLGTADTSDISSLSLWFDSNNNSVRDATDKPLGNFSYTNGAWKISGLNQEIVADSSNLFVVGSISDNATSGRTFRAALPVLGCNYSSGNDGPLDVPLQSAQDFTISDSPLQITYSLPQHSFTVGQDIELHAFVSNTSTALLDGIFVAVPDIINPQLLSIDSTVVGPISLPGKQNKEVIFTFGTVDVGSASWKLQAYSTASADSSVLLSTDPVTISSQSPPIQVELINSIPTAVTIGQKHIFPFSLRYSQSETDFNAAPARLDSITIQVADLDGIPQPASAAFGRLVLSSGYEALSVVETIPDTPDVTFHFSHSLVLNPGDEELLALRVDIDSAATASGFGLSIADANGIHFVDNNSGFPITIIAQGGFPLNTPSCKIDVPSQALAVSSDAMLNANVNYGQQYVKLMSLSLRHPGGSSDSRVQLTGLRIHVEDDLGYPVAAENVLSSIQLVQDGSVIGQVSTFAPGSDQILIKPFAPPVVDPASSKELLLQASVDNSPLGNGFSVVIDDSTSFELRDLSSGSLVAATTDTLVLSTGVLFPISSGVATFKCPAADPLVCVTPSAEQSVIAGSKAVALATVEVAYPFSGDCSPSSLSQVKLSVFDRDGRALDPTALFDRIGYQRDDGAVNYQSFVELSGGDAVFHTDSLDLVIGPGDSYSVTLVADFEANIPYDHFELGIDAGGFRIKDVTDPLHKLVVTDAASCGTEFPVISHEFAILLPAGQPRLQLSQGVKLSHGGEQGVNAFTGYFAYAGANPLGDLLLSGVHGMIVQRESGGFKAVQMSDLFSSLWLRVNGVDLDGFAVADGSDFTITLAMPQLIQFGTNSTINLVGDLQEGVDPGNYSLQFEDSSFVSISDRQSGTQIYPLVTDAGYPLQGIELSVMNANLANSFVNYPNPFNPVRGEPTTFGFVLPESGTLSLKVYTITGELVTTLIDNVRRPAGSYQLDRWDGVNENKLLVLPGTYFCRLSVNYDSGRNETVTRKVAVIR